MRVLLSIAEMAVGGAERVVAELASGLTAEGDAVAVAADGGPFDRLLDPGRVQLYPLTTRGRSPIRLARACVSERGAIRGFRPDLVHSHNVKATGVAAVARATSRPRAPLLATFHGVPPERYRTATTVLRLADHVVCVSQDLFDGLAAHGMRRERLSVIRNAVPPAQPLSAEARRAIDSELGLEDSPVVAIVGRLVPQKAHERFLEAVALTAPQVADAAFLVVGDGPLRSQVESRARELGVAERVTFTGVRQDARALIARADIVAFSSEWEGLPVTALEALAAGVPVVATEVQGMRELLGTGAGVVVPRDAGALADAIVELLALPERRARMGSVGREIVASRFSVASMVGAYRELYSDLTGGGGEAAGGGP